MEITSPLPKIIQTSPQRIHIPHNKPNDKQFVTLPISSSLQTQLPIQRPTHKQQKPIEKTPNKPGLFEPVTPSATISDILSLLDSLEFPISLDLYASFIKECTKSHDPLQAIELHNHIKKSSLRPSMSILNRLLLMYVCCDCKEYARELFDKMIVRSASSWAVMAAGYFENGDYEEVINLFVEMRCWDWAKGECGDSDKVAIFGIVVCVLKACSKTMNSELGKQMHGWITKMGYAENLVLSSTLMSFYANVGCSEGSDSIFYQVPRRNKVIWTAKIVNCCKEERFHEAIDVFRDMGKEGVEKNSFTVSSVLKACASMNDDGFCGQQIHASVVKSGLELNEHVQCGLISMYGKGGLVNDARKVFMINGNKRNVACWNAILSGYIQQGLGIEAVKILYEMKASGLEPQESLIQEVKFFCGSSMIGKRS